ncbi:MAG: endolytic transglycosylase MltG [Clostridiales bacterium]|nr:endolytic transglycosylase MltG [Clostridiales bacterium]
MKRFSFLNILIGIGIGMIITSIINIVFISEKYNSDNHVKNVNENNFIKLPTENMYEYTEDISEKSFKQENNVGFNTDEDSVKEIFIEKGMDSIEIAKLLEREKIISDMDEFLKKTYELNLSRQLKYGLKKIPEGSTIEEILKILTENH